MSTTSLNLNMIDILSSGWRPHYRKKAQGPQSKTLHHNDLITLWTMCVPYQCTQSIFVCHISDFEVAVYNILLPVTCLVLEGEGKTWRTPESLEEAFNDCEKGDNLY